MITELVRETNIHSYIHIYRHLQTYIYMKIHIYIHKYMYFQYSSIRKTIKCAIILLSIWFKCHHDMAIDKLSDIILLGVSHGIFSWPCHILTDVKQSITSPVMYRLNYHNETYGGLDTVASVVKSTEKRRNTSTSGLNVNLIVVDSVVI